MTPPLGTQVDFYGSGHAEDTEPQLGFVTQSWPDGTVNVAVFDRNGAPLLAPPTQIPLVEAGADRPEGPCCAVAEEALVESLSDSDHRAVNLLKEKLDHLGSRLDAVGERLDLQARRIGELQDAVNEADPPTDDTVPQGEDSPENAEAPAEEPKEEAAAQQASA